MSDKYLINASQDSCQQGGGKEDQAVSRVGGGGTAVRGGGDMPFDAFFKKDIVPQDLHVL